MSQAQNIGRCFLGILLLALLAGFTANTNRRNAVRFIDDSVIASGVEVEMKNDPVLQAIKIDVESFRGVVLLSGFVDYSRTADRAVKLANSVNGVNSVKNSIVVKRTGLAGENPLTIVQQF